MTSIERHQQASVTLPSGLTRASGATARPCNFESNIEATQAQNLQRKFLDAEKEQFAPDGLLGVLEQSGALFPRMWESVSHGHVVVTGQN